MEGGCEREGVKNFGKWWWVKPVVRIAITTGISY